MAEKYSEYAEYISFFYSLGFRMPVCRKICEKFAKKEDLEGLLDYMRLCDEVVSASVD